MELGRSKLGEEGGEGGSWRWRGESTRRSRGLAGIELVGAVERLLELLLRQAVGLEVAAAGAGGRGTLEELWGELAHEWSPVRAACCTQLALTQLSSTQSERQRNLH